MASLSQLTGRSFLHQMKVLSGPKRPQLFEVEYPFINDGKPFGEVRVIVDSALLVAVTRVKLLTGGVIVLVVLRSLCFAYRRDERYHVLANCGELIEPRQDLSETVGLP